jgi:hypothetical protein
MPASKHTFLGVLVIGAIVVLGSQTARNRLSEVAATARQLFAGKKESHTK